MAVTGSNKNLHMKDLKLTSGLMKNLILNSFGPIGKKIMLISSTGQNLVTKDGVTILSAIHLSHPVARCIMDSVQSFVGENGDGCKMFIIYLHHLLEGICSDEVNQGCWGQVADSASYRATVAKCLHEFMSQDFCYLSQQLQTFVYIQNQALITSRRRFDKHTLTCLLRSYFCGGLPTEYTHQLSELLATYAESMGDKQLLIPFVLRCFDNLVFGSVDSYSNSHSKEGIFLTGIFSTNFSPYDNVNAVLMQCPFEDGRATDDTISPFQLTESLLSYRAQVALNFLTRLKQNRVQLLLTLHKVPDYIAQTACELNIGIVSCLEDDDMEFLMCATGKVAVSSIWDELDSSCLVLVRSYESVYFTGRRYLRMVLERKPMCFPDSALFLCAPTDELLKQLKDVVRRSFKVISHCSHGSVCMKPSPREENQKVNWCREPDSVKHLKDNHANLKDNHAALDIIPGGGYFEYLLSHFLSNYILTNTQLTSGRKFCCQLLVKMLLALPQSLYENLSAMRQPSQGSAYLSKYSFIKQAVAENRVVGFYSSTSVTDPSEHGLWEGLGYKLAAVTEVVQLVESLIRIDSVVGVKRLPGPNLSHSVNDSETEDGYEET